MGITLSIRDVTGQEVVYPVNEGPVQRLRLTFSKGEALRWISHLDVARLWERALRRARIPVAYTQGFNPQLRIQFASALPTGCSGRSELADLWLMARVAPEDFAARVRPQLPQGVELIAVEEVDLKAPALQAMLRAADWSVAVEAPDVSPEDLRSRVDAFLVAERWQKERTRRPGQPPRSYDLRALVVDLRYEGVEDGGWHRLWMRLRSEPSATGRPDEVLDALGLADRPNRMERVALYFEP